MRIALRLFASTFLLAAATAFAQEVPAKHAQVELLSRQVAAAPGRELLLGVHFKLEKGWHIYWVNPGDSGQPPVFKWQLPPGFSAGEVRWPRPQRLQGSPQVADYGYHDDVLLIVPMHVARTANGGAPAQITLDARWLICREVCLADRAQLHLSLPIGSDTGTPNAATSAIFAGAARLVPGPLPARWITRAEPGKDDFVLLVRTGKPVAKAEFFPLDPGQVDNAAPQKVEPTAWGAKITLKKSDLLIKPITALRGVLVLASGDAYRLEARVTKR